MALVFDSWLVEFIAVLVTAITALYVFYQHRFQYWAKRGVPYPEPSFPYGNTGDVARRRANLGQYFKSLHMQFPGEKLVGTFQFFKPALLIRDPEEIKRVLVKDFAHFHDRGVFADEKIDPLAGHLGLMSGTKWKNLRAKLTPTFTSGKMKMMFPTMAACGEQLTEYLTSVADTRRAVEVKDVYAKYTTEIIGTCAFGIETNSFQEEDSEFRRYGKKAFSNSSFLTNMRFLLGAFVPFLAKLSRIPMMPPDVTTFFLGVVKETIEYREKNDVTRPDFMQLLIQLKNNRSVLDADDHEVTEAMRQELRQHDDGTGLTVTSAAAQAFVFFFAGFETSSTLMSFLTYELGCDEELQERVREEVDDVMKQHGGKITYEGIQEMALLDRVVAEALRKYPPAPALVRQCTKRYKWPHTDKDITLEPGNTVMVSIWGLHHDPDNYPDPQKFDPDRFLPAAKLKRHPFAYLPFGEGPRICIGSRFGLLQSKVGIASIVSRYRFKICRKTTSVPLVINPRSVVPVALGGINILMSKR